MLFKKPLEKWKVSKEIEWSKLFNLRIHCGALEKKPEDTFKKLDIK